MPNIVYTVAERIEMVRQHEQGLSYRRIVDHFAAAHPNRPIPSKATVQKMVKKFHDTGNLDPSLVKVTQPRKQLSEEKKLEICLAIEERAKKPLSQIAEELNVSKSTVHKILKSHKHRSHKLKKRPEVVPPVNQTDKGENEQVENKRDEEENFHSVCKKEPAYQEYIVQDFVESTLDIKDEYY